MEPGDLNTSRISSFVFTEPCLRTSCSCSHCSGTFTTTQGRGAGAPGGLHDGMTDCRDHNRHEEEGGAFPIQEKTELEGNGDCKWSMSPIPSPPCSTHVPRILLPCRDGDTLIPKWVWTLGRTLSGDPDIQGAVGTGQRTWAAPPALEPGGFGRASCCLPASRGYGTAPARGDYCCDRR